MLQERRSGGVNAEPSRRVERNLISALWRREGKSGNIQGGGRKENGQKKFGPPPPSHAGGSGGDRSGGKSVKKKQRSLEPASIDNDVENSTKPRGVIIMNIHGLLEKKSPKALTPTTG
ncbi:hypothetical protein QTP88_016410 [Uroleucon formosanum]